MNRTEADFDSEVRANLRRNFSAHLVHGLFGQTGFRLIQAPTLIPSYLYALSGSEWVVGVARAAQALGQGLTPIFGATLIEHRRRVLPVGFAIGMLMRLQILGIALAGFYLSPELNVVTTCIFLGLFGVFLGAQGVTMNVLASKVIPVERRGILLGLRNALAGVTATVVAYFGGKYLIDAQAFGNGYATTFLVAFVMTVIGLCMLLFVREPEAMRVKDRIPLRERLKQLPRILRNDRSYAAYFYARALGTSGRMAVPYYVLYASQQYTLSGTELGILTGAFILSNTLPNLVWGWVADRSGFRRVFNLSMWIWIASAVLLLFDQQFSILMLVFIGLGIGLGGFSMASQYLVLEFSSEENIPMRVGIANSGAEFAGAIGPLLGAFIISRFAYEPVFYIAIAVKLGALAIMTFGVRDPRFDRSR